MRIAPAVAELQYSPRDEHARNRTAALSLLRAMLYQISRCYDPQLVAKLGDCGAGKLGSTGDKRHTAPSFPDSICRVEDNRRRSARADVVENEGAADENRTGMRDRTAYSVLLRTVLFQITRCYDPQRSSIPTPYSVRYFAHSQGIV